MFICFNARMCSNLNSVVSINPLSDAGLHHCRLIQLYVAALHYLHVSPPLFCYAGAMVCCAGATAAIPDVSLRHLHWRQGMHRRGDLAQGQEKFQCAAPPACGVRIPQAEGLGRGSPISGVSQVN